MDDADLTEPLRDMPLVRAKAIYSWILLMFVKYLEFFSGQKGATWRQNTLTYRAPAFTRCKAEVLNGLGESFAGYSLEVLVRPQD